MAPSPLRIGYVPEHFSSPLLQLAASSSSIKLVSCPSGTGQLIKALKDQEIDIAVALTEALIAGIAKGSAAPREYKLIGQYVTSPLNWAVIVGKEIKYKTVADLRGEKIGISRIGSGSQVMASYMALREGWVSPSGSVEPIDFEVLDTFKALRDGVNDGRAAAFMWENFTTKPYLLAGEVRFIGHVLTPWSSWMIVADSEVEATRRDEVKEFLDQLGEKVRAFDAPEARKGESKEFVKTHFGYPEEDVQGWLDQVAYPSTPLSQIPTKTITGTLEVLVKAGVLKEPEGGWKADEFVYGEVAELL